MPKHRFKTLKQSKKILSTILATAIVVTSIPAVEFFRGAVNVNAAVTYEPKKIGVSLMCNDMLSGDNADNVYKALTRTNSLAEDSRNGSAFNNVNMLGLTYQNRHGGAGKSYWAELKSSKFVGLYDLAKKGQIEQSICANVKNHNHRSTKRHWNKIKQYGKIIFGYPKADNNDWFYGRLFETKDNSDYSEIGGNGCWNTTNPDRGYKNRLVVFMTAKKGCDGCSGAYIENVSIALKDTKAPTISSIKITSAANSDSETTYFKAGQTLYAKVKFSEYVRLADNKNSSKQSTNIKLGLSLAKKNTKNATQIQAKLVSLKGDTAIFSYDIPATIKVNNKTEAMDYFVSGLADIDKQSSLIVKSSANKNSKFDRAFLDNNGNTLSNSSSTISKLKSGINDSTKFENEIKKTTSAITDIAGNPLDINSFRDDSAYKNGVSISRVYLDAVSPNIKSVKLSSNQKINNLNDNENYYLKVGTKLTASVEYNENIKKVSGTNLAKIQAKFNIYSSAGKQITAKAKSIYYGDSTKITFEPVTITGDMVIKPKSSGKKKEDYRITILDIENRNLLKDYSDNEAGTVGDLRNDTSKTFYLDNKAPVIMVEDSVPDDTKTYDMARCDITGEVYRIVLNTTDNDEESGSDKKPFASGVRDGKGSISVDLQSSTVKKFRYILSPKELSKSELSRRTFKEGESNKNLILEGTDDSDTTFTLTGERTYVYLYLKFIDEIDYSTVTSGIKVKMTAADVNTNLATATIKYNYNPEDKISPEISYRGISLKENADNSAYQEAKVRIKDEGGVDINAIKYIWVKKGEVVPKLESYKVLPAGMVETVKTNNGKVTECIATIKTENVTQNQVYSGDLYVYAQDVSRNKNNTTSGKLVTANIDMTMPEMQISLPTDVPNKKSSLVVDGPFTSSSNDVGMFVAIEDPCNEGHYFVRKQSGKSAYIALNREEFLNGDEFPYSDGYDKNKIKLWTYAKITGSGSEYTIAEEAKLADNGTYRQRFLAIASDKYYGKLNVMAGTGFKASAFEWGTGTVKFDASKGKLIKDSFVMIPDMYSLSDTQDIELNLHHIYSRKALKVELTAKGNYGQQVDKRLCYQYNPEDYQPEYLSSLKNAKFSFKISNIRTNDFVTEDINYNSENTYIKLKNVDTGKYVYQWQLATGVTTDEITIPEDLKLENGHYAVEVSICNYVDGEAKDCISTATYDDIYLYDYSNEMTEAFGIDSVSTKINFTAKDEHGNDEKPPYYGFVKTGDYNFTRSFVQEREKDYTSDFKEAYDADTLYLGNCATDTYDDNQVISYDRTIKMSINAMEKDDLDNYWIKVWVGDGENVRAVKWFKFESFNDTDKTMSINIKPIDAAKVKNAETPEDFYSSDISDTVCEIPVFEGSNTISYQIMNIGGNKSEIHEIEIMYHTKAPTLNIDIDKPDKVVTAMEARVMEISSDLVIKDVNLYETDFKGDESKVNAIDERTFNYNKNGRHLYYAIDGYYNLSFRQFYIENIDSYVPTASFKSVNPATYISLDGEGEFNGHMENASLEVEVLDDKSLMESDIKISVDGREPYTVDLSEKWNYGDGYGGTYIGRQRLENTGMKEIQISFGPEQDGRYYLNIYIKMNDDIDATKKYKEKVNHTVEINVSDQVGNELDKKITTDGREFYGLNNVPKIKEVYPQPDAEMITLEFTANVMVTNINGNDVPEKVYERMDMMDRFPITKAEEMGHYFEGADLGDIVLKDYFGISKDGTYSIEYKDVYNNRYKETFKVEDFFGNYAADIQYSTLSKTNQNVVATITGVDKKAELSLKEGSEESDNYKITWNKDKSKATIEFSQNDSVTFNLTVKGAVEEKTVEYNVSVGNIDKKAPDDVQVTWVFKGNGDIYTGAVINPEDLLYLTTNNDIDVYISSPSEDIYAVNGKELKYTFTYSNDMDRSYTFEYADECGNEGKPVTVTLPDELVMMPYETPVPEEGEEREDKDAPGISAEVYAVYDGMAEYKTSWNPDSDSFEEIAEDIGYTGGYKIKYTLFDQSKSKIVVLKGLNASAKDVTYDSSSQKIDGVKVSENDGTVIITKKCSITVVAVDEKGNKVSHSYAPSKFDTEKPTVTVKKVGKSFTLMRLQFYTDDNTDAKNQNGTIVPVTTGLKMGLDEDGYYYYKEITNNGTYNTTFKDKSGNRTTVTTKITEIDNQAPTIKVSSWSPCYTNDGKAYEKLAPTEPVNTSVTLSLDFDKTVSELKVFYQKGDTWVEDKNTFSKTFIELGGRTAKVEFNNKVLGIVKVVATSPNGMSNEITDIDLVGIIDKTAPKVTFTQKTENNTVKVIYKADEKVLVTGCDYDTTYGANTEIPFTIKENGTYQLTFTDMAGNVTEKTITVNTIDETPPSVFAVGMPEDYVTPENCKVKVTMSEKGTITFQGKDYSVNAPVDANKDGKYVGDELDWITLPINSNGSYQIKATDEAGLVSYKLLEIKYVDEVAPHIQFNKSVISVSQGTSVKELKEMLLDDNTFILWDNVDLAPQITIKNMLSENQLKVQGIYEVTYVLTDSAGNKRNVNRYVKVISSANLKVRANGELMTSCDTTVLFDSNVDITLEKSKRVGESFKIYYKEGIRKAGSMKNAKVSKNGKLTDLGKGFHTLYIVTQNKESYLTYLYISR